MLWFTCKMLRLLSYCLFLICFNQVICANEGIRWINSDLSSLKDAADSGDAYAQGFLALCHLHGDKGLDVSHLEARFYAESSASRGHWLGNFVVGYLSRYKPLGPDPARVAKFLLKSFRDPDGKLIKHAAIGDPVAAYVLAEIFISDEVQTLLRPDMQMAEEYYNLSAASNYAPACVQIALIKIHSLSDSLSVDTNKYSNGLALLQKGIDQDLPAAHHYLGRCFIEGKALSEDKALALVHFQAAAERMFGPSLIMLADIYAYGVAGEPDQMLAFDYIQRAIEINYLGAQEKFEEYKRLFSDDSEEIVQVNLSDKNSPYLDGANTEKPNVPVLPADNLPQRAQKNLRLPSAYSTNEKLSTSDESDFSVIDKQTISPSEPETEANEQSILQIRENAKKIYWGRSTNNSMSDAFDAFEKCAKMGDAESARYLGIMYLRGKGVSKNTDEAIRWFEYAANQGDALAEKNLVSLRKIMNL